MSKKDNKLFLIFFCIILATILIAVNSMNSFLYKFNQSTDVHCFVTTARCMLRGDVLYKDVYEQYITKATEIVSDKTKEELDVANTNDELWIKFERAPKNYKFALARTKEIKNDDITS